MGHISGSWMYFLAKIFWLGTYLCSDRFALLEQYIPRFVRTVNTSCARHSHYIFLPAFPQIIFFLQLKTLSILICNCSMKYISVWFIALTIDTIYRSTWIFHGNHMKSLLLPTSIDVLLTNDNQSRTIWNKMNSKMQNVYTYNQ